jgi:hypothetical protein
VILQPRTELAKKFQPLLLEMPSYIQVKRKNTENATGVQLSMHQEESQRSCVVDTLWVVARMQATKANVEQQIPSWTGFNYLMCNEDSDNFHTMGYLPSINKSPTSMTLF